VLAEPWPHSRRRATGRIVERLGVVWTIQARQPVAIPRMLESNGVSPRGAQEAQSAKPVALAGAHLRKIPLVTIDPEGRRRVMTTRSGRDAAIPIRQTKAHVVIGRHRRCRPLRDARGSALDAKR